MAITPALKPGQTDHWFGELPGEPVAACLMQESKTNRKSRVFWWQKDSTSNES